MILRCFHTPGLSINSYIIADDVSRHAVIIDPIIHVDAYLAFAKQESLLIIDIVETHVHADFISGSKELKSRLNNQATIHCSASGGDRWIPSYADHRVKQNDVIDLGEVFLKALATPGHTPEHITWLCYDKTRSSDIPCLAFTGDFLFVGGVGRPDLLGEGEVESLSKKLYHSIFQILEGLPDFLEIYPAHGAGSLCGKGLSSRPTSTLGYEKLFNPFLRKKELKEWIDSIRSEIGNPPLNFSRIKELNLHGEPSMLSSNNKDLWIIDLRPPNLFAKKHIKGSINVPQGPSFCNWVGSIIAHDCIINLVGEDAGQLEEAKKNLTMIGFEDISTSLIWDTIEFSEKYPIDLLNTIDTKYLNQLMSEDPFVVDVRTPAEWNSGHIGGAHHVELSQLVNHSNKFPKNKMIYTICGSGVRSSIASSYLKKAGFDQVINVEGGMTAWKKQQFKTVTD